MFFRCDCIDYPQPSSQSCRLFFVLPSMEIMTWLMLEERHGIVGAMGMALDAVGVVFVIKKYLGNRACSGKPVGLFSCRGH